MANKGWIKLYRDIAEHWVYTDPRLLKVWIDILLSANHKPATVAVKGQLVDIKPGQFWTSLRKLSVKWGVNERTVKKYIALLQSDGMIFADFQVGYGTLITVHNYGVYQGFSDDQYNREYNREYNRTATENTTENTHKQEYKNNKEQHKNEKNKGLPPGIPDYFEEA